MPKRDRRRLGIGVRQPQDADAGDRTRQQGGQDKNSENPPQERRIGVSSGHGSKPRSEWQRVKAAEIATPSSSMEQMRTFPLDSYPVLVGSRLIRPEFDVHRSFIRQWMVPVSIENP